MYLKHNVAWLLVWIGITSAGRNRLVKIDNITKTATLFNKFKSSYC